MSAPHAISVLTEDDDMQDSGEWECDAGDEDNPWGSNDSGNYRGGESLE